MIATGLLFGLSEGVPDGSSGSEFSTGAGGGIKVSLLDLSLEQPSKNSKKKNNINKRFIILFVLSIIDLLLRLAE
jgi:hypothetical protein